MENPFSQSEEEYEIFSREDTTGHHVSYGDIASKLIKDRLWLTALELHTELVEAGKEVPKLREFFSNPVNFENQSRLDLMPSMPRSSSQATLDSLDMTRFSEDGERIVDDKVAILEFELRKAKETISALRANLTVATVEGTNCQKSGKCEPIKPHEQRALNFLINEYLLMNGYKLTSITFSDENEDQDFEDWDDVGLNMAKPAELLHLYRVGISETVKNTESRESQTDPIPNIEDLLELSRKVEFLEEENLEYKNAKSVKSDTCSIGIQCEQSEMKNEVVTYRSDISGSFEELNQTELESGKLSLLNETIDMDIEGDVEEVSSLDLSYKKEEKEETPSIISSDEKEESPKPLLKLASTNSPFEGVVWSYLPHLRTIDGQITHEGLVVYLGQSFSSILQQLPNNKEWLHKVVPILITVICLHPDEKAKDSLIHCLLTLKKRPNQEDRNIILAGICRLCETVQDETLNSQILSHCGEIMVHKYPEKRILIAQACAHLSLLISSELRDSFLISMLKQLVEDRDEGVRAQSAMSLAVIACYLSSDKYSDIEELTMKCLLDKSEQVVKIVQHILLPVVARRALGLNIFHTHLILNSLNMLDKIIEKLDKDVVCCNIINGLVQILPHLIMFSASADTVIESMGPDIPPPQHRSGFTNICKGLSDPLLFYEGHPVGALIGAFDYCLHQLSPWPQLSWVIDVLIPKLLQILDKVDPEREEIILKFVHYFVNLTAGFGNIFTKQHVKRVFLDQLVKLEKELIDMENDEFPSFSFIPVFCLGILAPLQCCEEELSQVLGRLLVSLGLCSAPLSSLRLTVKELAQGPKHSNALMSALWQGVVHQRASVKKATSSLLIETVASSSEQVISSRIIPALITLASDPDISVRTSTLPVYALIIEYSKNKEVLDKTYLQVRSVLDDPASKENASLMTEIVGSLMKIGMKSESSFREDTIFPELDRITKSAFDLNTETSCLVAASLVDAYSNMIFFEISKNCINTMVLPTLRLLETFCKEVLTTHVTAVTNMIKEVEGRVSVLVTSPSSSRSNMNLAGISSSNVEEMKQRVTKIFNSPKTSNIQSMFWKK
ncbi:lisH domain and HEAT repeat-containing protein KIAA1468-like [Cimex lectularius]|uniref:LisH domain-containing protein n=1 Tax=Cimex lectularius TaxID=79782 RepID=A0A8I6RQF1_CIMLE|nr:lisH domain and HEAT repeat-containing protein KIAA1468-like [Cimex lectularius]